MASGYEHWPRDCTRGITRIPGPLTKPMKLIRIASLAVLTFGLAAGVAKAALYTDYIEHNAIVSPGNPVGGTFDINDSGYDKSKEVITSAVAKFALRDDKNDRWYEPELGIVKLGGAAVDGFISLTNSWAISIGQQVIGSLLTDLSVDGMLKYKIVSLYGDFKLTSASLAVQTQTRAVPDGGMTLALLGAGLLGLVALRRRLA